MRRIVGVIAAVCTATSLGLSACGDSQPGPRGGGEEGDAGETSRGGASGSDGSGGSQGGGEAGAPAGGGTGEGGEPGGGVGGRGGSSESGGSGGTTSTGGTAQGGEGGNAGGDDGGSGGDAPDQLTICSRLMGTGRLAINTALAYETAMIADCRVNWTTTLYFDLGIGLEERDVFLNNLVTWNLQLWGPPCSSTAPTEFKLIHTPAPLTSADAQLLIDIYVEQATSLLAMSPPEIEEMRALLGRLSQPVIDRVSDEYSNPDCAGGAGGGSG